MATSSKRTAGSRSSNSVGSLVIPTSTSADSGTKRCAYLAPCNSRMRRLRFREPWRSRMNSGTAHSRRRTPSTQRRSCDEIRYRTCMKNLLLIVCLVLAACPEQPAPPANEPRQTFPRYSYDPRTQLCFASPWRVHGFTAVPCTDEVRRYAGLAQPQNVCEVVECEQDQVCMSINGRARCVGANSDTQ
jgi:hypothetical protein